MICEQHGWVGASALPCPEPGCPRGSRHDTIQHLKSLRVDYVVYGGGFGGHALSRTIYKRTAFGFPPIGESLMSSDPRMTIFYTWISDQAEST